MKAKKIIVLVLSIVVPIFITVMVALYSYGIVGSWQTNETKFIDSLFDDANNSQESIETYVKFNSERYKNNYQNVSLYKDYRVSNEKVESDLPYCDLGTLKFQAYTLISQKTHFKAYYNSFIFFDVDNSETFLKNIAVIFVEETSEDSVENLNLAIQKYTKEVEMGTIKNSIYLPNQELLSKNMLWEHGDPLPDIGGTAKVVDGYASTPYIAMTKAGYTYYTDDSERVKLVSDLDYCNFAIIALNDEKEPTSMEVLGTGQIKGLEYDAEDYLEANPDANEGYGLVSIPALNKAGYFKFVFPTVLWQTAVAAAVTGVLGFLFYRSWLSDQKKEKEKRENPNKKKE